jgi:hypothetical protein
MKRDWRDQLEEEEAVAARMARRAAAEHSRLQLLSGCRHWLQVMTHDS